MYLYAKVITGAVVAGSILLFNLYNSGWVARKIEQKNPAIWEPFNSTNPNIDWCPHASCSNSPICTPCRRRFLLIIATGRSGSTTLLSMMNQLPGVRLSGENKNELKKEMDATNNLFRNNDLKPNINQKDAYRHNQIPYSALSCATQKMFEMINPPEREDMNRRNFDDSRTIIGFKTISFHNSPQLEEIVQFVKDSFPCLRVILNIRSDVEEQGKSRKKYFGKVMTKLQMEKKLQMENSRIRNITNMFGDEHARLLDMSSWTKEETGLQDLNDVVHWLGFRNCKFNSLYHENKAGYQLDKTTRVTLGPNCHYPDTP